MPVNKRLGFGILGAAVLAAPMIALAVTFSGNVLVTGDTNVTGSMSKGSGTFVIDHPLDPKNMLLFHSFVESPDVKNIYDGLATLDNKGEVTIQLPAYFDALNNQVRYQFFPLHEAMPNLYIKSQESNNMFTIAGGVPNGKVSWQITGIRHDAFITANPIIPEVQKTDTTLVKRGECIYPPLCQ